MISSPTLGDARQALVVEDSPIEARVVEAILVGAGFSVTVVESGEEAIQRLEELRPLVILSDVVMPGMSGYELCYWIRERESLATVPVLLVSSLSDPTDVLQAIECGANSFITKPFRKEHLLSRIENLMDHSTTPGSAVGHNENEVWFEGKRYLIHAGRRQILDLLLASFDEAVHRNLELGRVRSELAALNGSLEERIAERTRELREEIADRERAESSLIESEERFRALFDGASMGILLVDSELQVLVSNRAFLNMVGRTTDELQRLPIDQIVHQEERGRVRRALLEVLSGTRNGLQSENRLLSSDRDFVWCRWTVSTLPDSRLVLMVEDLTQQKLDQETIHQLVNYNELTGLANSTLFHNRLEQTLCNRDLSSQGVAVLVLVLDRFKLVRDTLGQAVGDRLLVSVASRLRKAAESDEVLAQKGGDEFMILTPTHAGRVSQRAISFLDALKQDFDIGGRALMVNANVGISRFPEDGEDAAMLLKNATIALRHSQMEGPNVVRQFTESMNESALERLTLQSDIRRALERQEFALVYQPQVSLATGEIVGVEALVRWEHPLLGTVPPNKFIPLAEEIDHIGPLTDWVLKTALTTIGALSQQLGRPLRVAINLSARLFREGRLISRVAEVLAESGLDPQWVDLELTEGAVMEDPKQTVEVLHSLKRLGVQISIDDFGTGYSSLSYLRQFPIDVLKIDRSFVDAMNDDEESQVLPRLLISLAHHLGMEVIAEGVENELQLDLLRQYGCDEMQGYLFSEPVDVDSLGQLLIQDRRVNLPATVS